MFGARFVSVQAGHYDIIAGGLRRAMERFQDVRVSSPGARVATKLNRTLLGVEIHMEGPQVGITSLASVSATPVTM